MQIETRERALSDKETTQYIFLAPEIHEKLLKIKIPGCNDLAQTINAILTQFVLEYYNLTKEVNFPKLGNLNNMETNKDA